MDAIDGSRQSAHPVRSNSLLWLQGTLILEISRDLVIPVCQSRALRAGFTTCYTEHRITETAMVETSSLRFFQNAAQRHTGGVLP